MLDIKRIRFNLDEVKLGLEKRGGNYEIDRVVKLDEDRRNILMKVEEMKAKQNEVSKQIPALKKEGKDVSDILKDMKLLSDEVSKLDSELKQIEEEINSRLLNIPNVPHPDAVKGETDADNIEVRTWGEPREFDFEIKAHWDLGTDLDILDFERASKITGARFTLFKGLGARLERSLMNFMLNTHTSEHGYTEVAPPFIANKESMTGTGQLPKFAEDMFKLEGKDYYLIPTAEVPVTNIHRGEILEEDMLPVYNTAYTPCFRQEAGSAGRDTRGVIRNHQFDKVELVKLVEPENSYEELEKLTNNAEKILQLLNIPYRVVELCTGDLGFSSAKTYDIEVWMPSYNRYVEISSCSNFEDYQARRANIRYRSSKNGKVEYVHTLNGSGLAVGRAFAALIENYQNKDGSIDIPEVLQSYMGGIDKIR
jgi:seryl-tRNA synthetase